MSQSHYVLAMATAAILMAGSAQAAVVTVTGGTGSPTATSWGVLPGENSAGASAVITASQPRNGNGSVELSGDRTRFQLGIQYGGFTNLMPLSGVTGLSFDWRIAGNSVNNYNPDYTPALRLLVQDGSQRSELIWEGAYNGTYGNTLRDTWYSTSFADNFYQFVAGSGVTLVGGAQSNKTITSWISQNYSANAYVSGLSVGDGSGALATYHAFADDVVLGTSNGTTTYNFEVAASTAVPEPASMALLLTGFGVAGLVRRRRAIR